MDTEKGCSMQLTLCLDDAMKEIVLPPLMDEPKILQDFHHTWTVENWRSLSKREHGPVFQAGGFPWCVSNIAYDSGFGGR